MNPQLLPVLRWVITLASGILFSRGMISAETRDYLGGDQTLAAVAALGGFATLAWSLWANRPHGLIKRANGLKQVSAIVTAPKTAAEIQEPGIVGSVSEAAQVVPRHGRPPVAKTTIIRP